jgi:hypothetical protein
VLPDFLPLCPIGAERVEVGNAPIKPIDLFGTTKFTKVAKFEISRRSRKSDGKDVHPQMSQMKRINADVLFNLRHRFSSATSADK